MGVRCSQSKFTLQDLIVQMLFYVDDDAQTSLIIMLFLFLLCLQNGSPWRKSPNAFRYTSGQRRNGRLELSVGGGDNSVIEGASCGWTFTFQVPFDAVIEVSFDWTHFMSDDYEDNEYSELMVLFDGKDKCTAPQTCFDADVSRLNGGGSNSGSGTTRVYAVGANTEHTVTFALWNDLKTWFNEASSASFVS
jgi:hypothetical protein